MLLLNYQVFGYYNINIVNQNAKNWGNEKIKNKNVFDGL